MVDRSRMQWMTMAWWRGETPQESAAGYWKHFDAIRDRLPKNLRRFHEEVTLHDGKITCFNIDFERKTVEIELLGYEWQPGKLPDSECRWNLIYNNVQFLKTIADPDGGLGGPSGFGDLGYDELDVTIEGVVIHRMVFSTSVEMAIGFRSMKFEKTSR